MSYKINEYEVRNQTDSLFANPIVKVLVPLFCIAVDFFTVTESVNTWFSFSPVILYMVAAAFSLAIDGIPVYMSTQGDLKNEKNKLWLKVLAVLFLSVLVFRFFTGNQILSPMVKNEYVDRDFLLVIAKVFSALLLTIINIATSLLCYYIGFKSQDMFLHTIENQYTDVKRELFELEENEKRTYEYYQVDLQNKEVAKEILQSYMHLWKLLSEITLKDRIDVSAEELNELYEEKMILEKKIQMLK